MLSGDTALRWIFSHTGSKTILVLIDIDEDDVCDPAETGTTVASESFLDSSSLIYTPPHSPHDPHSLSQHHHSNSESEATGPYGLSLLRIIAHYVAIGVFRNVAPIGKFCRLLYPLSFLYWLETQANTLHTPCISKRSTRTLRRFSRLAFLPSFLLMQKCDLLALFLSHPQSVRKLMPLTCLFAFAFAFAYVPGTAPRIFLV